IRQYQAAERNGTGTLLRQSRVIGPAGTKVRSPLPTTVQNQDLVSHQDGFGNNRSEPTGSTKPDDDNDDMQKKSENVAHAEDGIRPKKLKN
ncbi:MAG TPA: hypothetical protein VF749_17315, partial [Candidatus Acidoferrum sp.]